jgi:hypothetical protein
MDAAHHLVLLAGPGAAEHLCRTVLASLRHAAAARVSGDRTAVRQAGAGRPRVQDFQTSYLIGSVALAIILFEGGLKTKRSMLKIARGLRWRRLSPSKIARQLPGLSTIPCMDPSSTGDASPWGARVTVTVHTFDKLLSSDQPSIQALAKCQYRYK